MLTETVTLLFTHYCHITLQLWFSMKKPDQINKSRMRDIKTWLQGLCVQSCWSIACYIPD